MDVSMSLIGQLLLIHIIVCFTCTVWYARRPSLRTTGGSMLLIFAWLMPVIGVLCRAIFLAAASKDREPSIV